MEKQVKKSTSNTLDVFRKLTVASAVFTWFVFIVAGVFTGVLIYVGIDNLPKQNDVPAWGILILVGVGLALLCLLAYIGIAIARSVLSKKLTTVGGIGWKTIVSVLITLSGLTLLATGGLGYLAQFLSSQDVKPIVYFEAGAVIGVVALTTLGVAIFDIILNKRIKK